MSRIKQILKTGLKVTTFGGISVLLGGFTYLQYINSVLGPLHLKQEEAMSYYK